MTHLTLTECQNLKAWRMPQDTYFIWVAEGDHYFQDTFIPEGRYHIDTNRGQDFSFPEKKIAACPTLEELLEWLGDRFDAIQNHGDSRFTANSRWGMNRNDPEDSRYWGEGDTPFQAVYALCEALYANVTPKETDAPINVT